MKVYITNATIEEARPVLFGMVVDDQFQSVERVCINVTGFMWDIYAEPYDGPIFEEDAALKWVKDDIDPVIHSINDKEATPHAGANKRIFFNRDKVVHRRKLCGFTPKSWMAKVQFLRSTDIRKVADELQKPNCCGDVYKFCTGCDDVVRGARCYNSTCEGASSRWRCGRCRFPKLPRCKVYKHDVDPLLTFLHRTDLRCFGYANINIPDKKEATIDHRDDNRISRCEVEIQVHVNNITAEETDGNTASPSVRIVSFDLETDGLNPEGTDEVRMISAYACDFPFDSDVKPPKSVLFTRHKLATDDPTDYEVSRNENEMQLIKDFAAFVDAEQAVFLTGWNTAGFDIDFLVKRVQKKIGKRSRGGSPRNMTLQPLSRLSWLRKRPVKGQAKNLTSAAYGINQMMTISVAGLICMDGLLLARKELKLIDFKLKTCAEWAGHAKGDVTYQEMVEAFDSKDAHKLREVADYCMKDAKIVIPILARMEQPTKVIAMTITSAVPPDYVVSRGMQVLSWSLILEEAQRHDMVPNRFPSTQDHDYEGATVIPPKAGYYQHPVAVLDFKSLYPSCMLANNVCVSTMVEMAKDSVELRARYPPPPDDPKRDYNNEDSLNKDFEKSPEFCVVDIGHGNVVVFDRDRGRGVIPIVLQQLLDMRQYFKDQMKLHPKGSVRWKQLNARQLAVKVSANSLYGFLGARTAPVGQQSVYIAASVTSLGRIALEKTRVHISKLIEGGDIPSGTEVVYGDSVTGDTPLVIRQDGVIRTCRIDELVMKDEEWECLENGKLVSSLARVEVWNDTGFTPIRRVIRHACVKPIVRVVTGIGLVDVTTDHSLLAIDGSEVTPLQARVGQELLHARDDELLRGLDAASSITYWKKVDQVWALGLFMSQGSWPFKITGAGLHHAQDCMPFTTTTVVREEDGLDALLAVYPAQVQHYREWFFNDHGEKRVPPFILSASLDVVMMFWRGYMSGTRTTTLGKEAMCGMWIVARRLGFHPAFTTEFQMTLETSDHPFRIHTMTDKGVSRNVVYDLETESHHFHVGPGDLVVHNTDSVMVMFPGISPAEASHYADLISKQVTEQVFAPPMELENEELMMPCLFLTKKRYAGLAGGGTKLIIKGISTQRRDYPKIVQHAMQTVLDALLRSTDGNGTQRALDSISSVMEKISCGRIDMEDLVVVKEINKMDYKSLPPHVVVARKITKRNPERALKAGDRVAFVVARGTAPNQKVAERGEDPEYMKRHGLIPDFGYYAQLAGQQVMDLFTKANLERQASAIIEPRIQQAIRNTGLARKEGQLALPWGQNNGLRVPSETLIPVASRSNVPRTIQTALPWSKSAPTEATKTSKSKPEASKAQQRTLKSFFKKS
jgi:DNA polymerase elongation subunit (family B)